MANELTSEVRQLVDGPNFAHLATLMPDGSPQSVPVWIGREGDHLVICTGENSLKGRNTLRDPRVALSIVNFANPYEEVQIRGRVTERRPDPDLKMMDPISHKYTGKPLSKQKKLLTLFNIKALMSLIIIHNKLWNLKEKPHMNL